MFVQKLIDYVCANGYVKTDEVLEKAPFDKPKTIYNIFEGPQLDEIFDIIDSFKKTAMVEDIAGWCEMRGIVYNLLYNNSLKWMEKVERINNLDAILMKKLKNR